MRGILDRIDGVNPYYVTILAFVNHIYAQKLIDLEKKNKSLDETPRKEKK